LEINLILSPMKFFSSLNLVFTVASALPISLRKKEATIDRKITTALSVSSDPTNQLFITTERGYTEKKFLRLQMKDGTKKQFTSRFLSGNKI